MDDTRNHPASPPPLYVELEGALIPADFKWEKRIGFFVRRVLNPGRPDIPSDHVAAMLVATNVPRRPDVLEFLRREQRSGRRIILVSRLPGETASALIESLEFTPDELIAGTVTSGRDAHFSVTEAFDLVCGRAADPALCSAARRIYQTSRGAVRGNHNVDRTLSRGPHPLMALARALRPHQWVKNLLVVIPLILAHRIWDHGRVIAAILAFGAMCLCASVVYIVNDLLDIQADRRHPTKCHRPFASGSASIPSGLMLAVACLVGSVAFMAPLPSEFDATIGLYLLLTTLYSFWLKRKPLVDVILLAVLYTLRIIAGALAVDVPLTMWLLAFSMFFFLSLAFIKRYSELIQLEHAGGDDSAGRGYRVSDLRIIEAAGMASGYMSVLVFCNYLDSAMVRSLYARPQALWLVAPVLLYWITRAWLLARRRLMHDDPVVFALRDRTSRFCGMLVVIVVVLAWSGWPHK